MSLTESDARGIPEPPFEDWGDGPAPYAPGERPTTPGDRTPPQDMAAEQSVLGAMLISKDAIADVSEAVRGVDFYRPIHESIHEAVIDLYGRGEPVDMITVAAELQRRGELARIGGAPYLHTLSANVPIAANASYYAEIVREKAILRRLVDAGTKIVQSGYAGEGKVDDIVDNAQAEIYKVTDRRTAEDYAPLSEIMDGVLDEIEAIGNREAGLYGVPTGFADLDDLTNGLHAGQMIIVAARPAMGKALALDTPLATPSGWTTMGQVAVGDQLYDARGRPTRVVAATEVMHGRPCYEVTFSDGSRITADAEHQWLTETRAARASRRAAAKRHHRSHHQRILPAVVTTEHLAATLTVGAEKRAHHAVVNGAPLQGHDEPLPVPAYTLGAWLGGGTSSSARITCETDEIPMHIEAEGLVVHHLGERRYAIALPERPSVADPECPDRAQPSAGRVRCRSGLADHGSVHALLRQIGVLGDKHIPQRYLRAGEAQRRALLAGLMDTDGTVVRGEGSCRIAVTGKRLADDVHELVISLGYRCGRTTKPVPGRSGDPTCHTLDFSTTDDVFRLTRKQLLHKEERPASTARIGRRHITDVRRVDSVPVRCVQVDNEEHLYLAGTSMIPTHNSTLALDLCRAASIHNNLASVFFSLEMTRSEITMRLLSAEARVPLNHIRNGQMNDDDWQLLARKMGEISGAPMFIDDSPNMTMMEIRAKARRLKQRHDLRLIVIDYMQLMSSGKKVESRQLEVSEFSRQIKLLAKELELPIIALSQLNRGPEQRADKKPMMSDLRESGCLTADTRLMRADTNAEITLGELMSAQVRDIPVWSLDDRLKLVPRTLTHAFPSGTKPVFELTLASGRRVNATANHRFLTYDGWMPLSELVPGSRLGSIRHVPAPLAQASRDQDEIVLLAHLLGDGAFLHRQPIRYASLDEADLTTLGDAMSRRFGITPARDDCPAARVPPLGLPAPYHLPHGRRHPIAAWLDEDGRSGLRSHETFVPDWVFGLPKAQVGLFLRHIWATDGSIGYDETHRVGRVAYASTSRRLVDDLARLLLRHQVFTRIKRVCRQGYRDGWRLDIDGAENQLRFLDDIGVHGLRGDQAVALAATLRDVRPHTNLDTVPPEVWDDVRQVLSDRGMTHRQLAGATGTQFGGSTRCRHAPSRQRLATVAAVLDDAELEVLATNDVFWDTITSVEPIGEREVFDATVLGTHNFVVEGVAAHNSLEQDADMVILLHREDVYEKESTRPGEADLIVAKHRNGPTRDITVAFQGHYSRFVDMAH